MNNLAWPRNQVLQKVAAGRLNHIKIHLMAFKNYTRRCKLLLKNVYAIDSVPQNAECADFFLLIRALDHVPKWLVTLLNLECFRIVLSEVFSKMVLLLKAGFFTDASAEQLEKF